MQCLDIKKRIRRNESGRKLEISCNMIKKMVMNIILYRFDDTNNIHVLFVRKKIAH